MDFNMRKPTTDELAVIRDQVVRAKRTVSVDDLYVTYKYQDNFTLALIATPIGRQHFGMAKRMVQDEIITGRGEKIALARAARQFALEYGQKIAG